MPKPSFLESYSVHEKSAATSAARRKEIRTGRTGIVADRSERIQAYLERLEEIFLHPDPKVRERRMGIFKEKFLYPDVLTKPENFPESYFEYQKQQFEEKGGGKVEISDEEKKQEIAKVRESQRLSLDAWIDYLTGDDCKYPSDVKFFAIQGVLKLGTFDTKTYKFSKRDKTTTVPFCEIDRDALSKVLGAMEAVYHNKDTSSYTPELLTLIKNKNSFGDMYAEVMRFLDQLAKKDELLPITDGKWRVFEKDSDPKALVESLSGMRSNLCIADIGSATRYLQTGSVEVFFSFNRAKQPTVPRIAVAFNEQGVYEVRGTFNKSEDIDPFMSQTNTLSKRIKNLPGGESFMVKDACMKRMTTLYNKCFKKAKKTKEKTYLNPELSKEDLRFLYEFDAPIEGFGYDKDPRIEEVRSQRNYRADLAFVFDCSLEELSRKEEFPLSNIPTFTKLPSQKILKDKTNGYRFDRTWEQEYREGRASTDFILTQEDLVKIGITDKKRQTSILEAMEKARKSKESIRTAKVFDINETIKEKKKENPSHPDFLTTKELLEAIDDAGYRPASLAELLAYAKSYWEPNPKNRTKLSDEQKVLQHADAPFVYAFGAAFTGSDGSRDVPYLDWLGGDRYLDASVLESDWYGHRRFLVLRKESS